MNPRAHYALALAGIATLAAVLLPLREHLDVANIDMVFLLAVLFVALRLGKGPAVAAAVFAVALFDFFYVPPYYSFAVEDSQYLITFAVMLAVALAASHLAARLAERSREAIEREHETRTLYELARQLASAGSIEEVTAALATVLGGMEVEGTLLIADAADEGSELLFTAHPPRRLGALELGFARSAFARGQSVEVDALAGTGIAVLFLPLAPAAAMPGVLALTPRRDDAEALRHRRPVFEAIASLTGLVVERLRYAETARRAEFDAASERLRTTLLSSLSHDLRTPLTGLVGLADALARRRSELPADAADTAAALRDQAGAMHRMLSNLLDMARLQDGHVTLRCDWQPVEEVVGASTRALADALAGHALTIDVPADLPLVRFDAVLMERVLCNLLENAAKYSPPGSAIRLAARCRGGMLELTVESGGSRFPAADPAALFEPFVRGVAESPVPGTGLGLAICRAVMEAHGGTLGAENTAGGARVTARIPLGTPPAFEEAATHD